MIQIQDVQIRPVLPGDLDALAVLFEEYRLFYGKQPLDRKELLNFLENLRKNPEVALQFVLLFNGQAIGFATLYFTFSSLQARRAAVLNDLYINSEHRRSGLGRVLFQEAREYCRKNRFAYLQLETAATNLPARKLYDAEGGTPSDFLVYEFDLDDLKPQKE